MDGIFRDCKGNSYSCATQGRLINVSVRLKKLQASMPKQVTSFQKAANSSDLFRNAKW